MSSQRLNGHRLTVSHRYNSITRFNSDHSRSARPRRKTPDLLPYLSHHKSESVSSSSSSVSPSTPSLSIPDPSFSTIDTVPESYFFESLAGWHQSSSPPDTMDELVTLYSSPGMFDMKDRGVLTESLLPPQPSHVNPSHQSFDVAMNQVLSTFPNDSGSLYSTSNNTTPENFFSKELLAQRQANNNPSNVYSIQPLELFPTYPHYSGISNDVASQLALFDTSQMGVNWETTVPAFETSTKVNNNSVSKFRSFINPLSLTLLSSSMYFELPKQSHPL